MKDWVKPFLLKESQRFMNEMGFKEDIRQFTITNFEREIASDEGIWNILSEHLNCHFGIGAMNPDILWFTCAFGSVLADLPEEVFLKIRSMKNVFYTFTPNPGAEVKHFVFDEDDRIENWDRIIVVTFPYEVSFMPPITAKGTIVHELAHVYAHPDQAVSNEKMEDEADQLPIDWGFEEEIKAMRDYYMEEREQNHA